MKHQSMEIKRMLRCILSDKNIKLLMDVQKNYSYSLFMHGVSVATYSAMLMFQMNRDVFQDVFQDVSPEKIIRGALLHDIGKISISKKLLEKNGRLTKEEFNCVKGHPIFGYEQVGNHIGSTEKEIILSHHEKLDGSGYPYGKKDIPLYVQIVTVADMYDALVSKRSYKKMYTHQEAIEILKKEVNNGKINKDILCELDIVNQ